MEGLITIVAAVISKFFIVDWPETSRFLNAEERQLLTRRLREDAAEAKMDRMDKKAARRVFSDWKVWIGYVYWQFGQLLTCTDYRTPGA